MTNMNLLQAMGHIDPGLIAEAAPDTARRKHATKPWIKWASLAACLCLIIAIGVQVFPALITATTVVKPSKPSSGLAMVAKLPVIRLLDADEAFEVQVGYGDMTGVYQYATLEIRAPGFEITDAQGNVYKDQYARRINDFASDKYKISSYDKIAENCYYESFTLKYVGDGAKASGGISFVLTTLQHGEPSTAPEKNIGPRAELVNVYYEIKNGIMILTMKRKDNGIKNNNILSNESEKNEDENKQYWTFIVTNITDSTLIVAEIGEGGNALLARQYKVPNWFDGTDVKIKVGDKITVVHNGEVTETEPTEFAVIYEMQYKDSDGCITSVIPQE